MKKNILLSLLFAFFVSGIISGPLRQDPLSIFGAIAIPIYFFKQIKSKNREKNEAAQKAEQQRIASAEREQAAALAVVERERAQVERERAQAERNQKLLKEAAERERIAALEAAERERARVEQERVQAERDRAMYIASLKQNIERAQHSFDTTLSSFFGFFSDTTYQATYKELTDEISVMKKKNTELKEKSSVDKDYSDSIERYTQLAEEFRRFYEEQNIPKSFMIEAESYGKINSSRWNIVSEMKRNTVDSFIAKCWNIIITLDYPQIFEVNVNSLLLYIWFYAVEKPFSKKNFDSAVSLFMRLSRYSHIEVFIAELYAIKQMGSEDVLRDRVREKLKGYLSKSELAIIASSLMWMGAYKAEKMILEYMLNNGVQMSAKMQERLHSLANNTGTAPENHAVASDDNILYFDVSALAWKDTDFAGLFDNLEFQEKNLSYSLAIRDEDKELFLTNGKSIPVLPQIQTKLDYAIMEEYGSSVTASMKTCYAISGSSSEKMEGILVQSSECKQLGVLVHVSHIGKKFNIKFYTLFMPCGVNTDEQKQQVFSMIKKLSPTVTMWEKSMKETVLMSIQQLLNAAPQQTNDRGNADAPIF